MADSYFGDESWIRRVHRENAVGLSGPRALLMQAAHPVAFTGFFAHTGALAAPYERLDRTAAVMHEIAFGSRARADRMTRRVRAVHRRVRGVLPRAAGPFPAGTPYAADDPALLLWILAALADSALVVYGRYVRTLARDERDAYWRDFQVVGQRFGLRRRDMPRTIEGFDDYMAGMLGSGELHVTPRARELAVRIVMRPPVPLAARPLLELANFVTVGLLPAEIRRQYGFSWDPARGLALLGGAEYAKRVLVPLLPGRLRYGVRPQRAGEAAASSAQ
jgi:uncharacterized protein (DUF2236 family)